MATSIEHEERGLYFLIRIHGEFTYRTLFQLRELAEKAIEIGHINIAVDLSNVRLIDSGGIGFINNLNQKMVGRGGSAYLIAVPEAIKEPLDHSSILSIVPNLKTLEDADREIG